MAFALPAIVQAARIVRPKTEIWYPFVSGLTNGAAQSRIRHSIQTGIHELQSAQGGLEDPRAEMTGWFEVKTNQRHVFSLSLYNYAYTGGAHGLTLQKSLTYRTDTGKSYTLGELFKPGSPYIERLTAIVQAQIKARDIPVFEFDPFKAVKPDQDFYIADRSLVLYFQLYEITPYVYGFPYFPISVYEIQELIDEEGPLGVMLPND